jgi:glutamine phosphoribosylpyrophosphate amidotransferase
MSSIGPAHVMVLKLNQSLIGNSYKLRTTIVPEKHIRIKGNIDSDFYFRKETFKVK